MLEYPFELSLCARLEADREAVIARQLGGGVVATRRVLDVVLVAPGPEFDRRAAITPETIPPAAIASGAGPGRFRPIGSVLDLPPDRARRVAERAAEVGFFELERRDGRPCVRQVARYPDWFDGIVGLENKPDLGDPGDLATQLRKDLSLGLVDQLVVATGSYVTGAHRNRIPDPVGIWRFDGDGIDVIRDPEPLDADDWGVELLERHPARDEIRTVSPGQKARARRRLAERAYGKGWRPDDWPACRSATETTVAGGGAIPYCRHYDRIVDPGSNCGPTCPGHASGDPPDVDPVDERTRRTPWVADPEGRKRRQSGLDRFE